MPPDTALTETAKPSTGLKELADAANEAARREATQWFFFVTLLVLLAATVGSVSDRTLLLASPVRLPLLGIDLPLAGFAIVAPAILVVLHFYLLAQLAVVRDKVDAFLDAAEREAPRGSEAHALTLKRLDGFPLVQLLAAERRGERNLAVRAMIYYTLVLGPVLLLLFFQFRFLPYQDVSVTWAQRGLILLDLALLWWLMPLPTRLSERVFGAAVTAGIAGGSLLILQAHGEPAERVTNALPPVAAFRDHVAKRTLVLPDEDFVPLEGAALEAASRTVILRERNLRGAVLTRADLRRADLTGADLSGADLSGADLRGAKLDGATLRATRLADARLENASLAGASLPGAVLDGARLQRATLDRAVFDGASFRGATLRGASAKAARGIAAGFDGADLAAADLRDAVLPAAIFAQADARGAVFTGAELSAADFATARLDGADFADARLWRARGPNHAVDGATPTRERPAGLDAHLDGTMPPLVPPARHQAVAEQLVVLFRPAAPEEDKQLLRSWEGRARQPPADELHGLICESPYDPVVVRGLIQSGRIGAMGWLRILRMVDDALEGKPSCPAGRSIPHEDIDLMRRAATALHRRAR